MATSEDEHSAINREENEPKPYNKCLMNLVCSVCTGKCLLSFFSHRPRSFDAQSVGLKTSGKYFPIQSSHSANNPLIMNEWKTFSMFP